MNALPFGVVTFLFTDVEGSTRLWQRYPASMGAALSRHHRLLLASIEKHGGYLFQIVGDGSCSAFVNAVSGIEAAIDAQRALTADDWEDVDPLRVRMALHTGEAEVRLGELRSGEYVSGLTLSHVARLLSAGRGGQILVSQSAADQARAKLPAGIDLVDLGFHLLRDLERSQRIFQVVAPGLRTQFPALKALDALPHNLPPQFTSFIGREAELTAVKEKLEQTTLLSLSGAGGSGKTRLSIQLARSVVNRFDDGAWFVELAPVTDPAFLADAVAHVFGLREQVRRSAEEVLADHLRDKSLLLILDNCEHLIDPLARFAQRLLRRCPAIKIVTTTREALGIPGEIVVAVGPLEIPQDYERSNSDLGTFSQCESIRLFVDRATAVQPDFSLTALNAPLVAEICVRLDGIPLAIELAAARAKALSPVQILDRLRDRFRLLTGGSRTAVPRQQTMRAAIDWSFDLLAAPERAMLQRLAVFSGGCTLTAAESVAAGGDADRHDVLDLLTRLIDKSLVVARADSEGSVRYGLLESVRQYLTDKLVLAGELDALRGRHLDYFLALAETAESLLYGALQLSALRQLEAESDNMRAALEWAAITSNPLPGLKLAIRLGRYWSIRGDYGEGRLWTRRMLSIPNAEAAPDEYAWANYFEGFLAWFQGDVSTVNRSLNRSLEIAQSTGNKRCVAYALDFMGIVPMTEGNFDLANRFLSESRSLLLEIGDQWGIAFNLWHIGEGLSERHEHEQALRVWEQSFEIFQALGDQYRSGVLLRVIGLERVRKGESTSGIQALRVSLQYAVERRAKFEIGNTLWAFAEAMDRESSSPASEAIRLGALGVYQSIGSLRTLEGGFLEIGRARRWFAEHRQNIASAFDEGRIPEMTEAVDLAMNYKPDAEKTQPSKDSSR